MSDNNVAKDILAEQAVIAGLFNEPTSIDTIGEVVAPEDFFEPRNEIIYSTILKLREQGKAFDPISLAADLKRDGLLNQIGGVIYLREIINPTNLTSYATDPFGYAQIVKENSRLRQLKEAAEKILEASTAGSGYTAEDATLLAEKVVFDITNEENVSQDVHKVRELYDPAVEEMIAAKERPEGVMPGIPTGFVDLDEKTSGFHGGQFIIIAARPGVGKALALDTLVPTPTGFTTMGDIQVGDEVYGIDGKPVNVVATTETMYDRPCYRIEFWNETVVADAEHLWKVVISESEYVITTEQLYKMMVENPNLVIELPTAAATQTSENNLSLGNASQLAEEFLSNSDASPAYAVINSSVGDRVEFFEKVTRLTPKSYTSIFETYHVGSSNKAKALKHIAGSLGIRSRVKISSYESSLSFYSSNHYFIRSIEPVASVPVRCIQVANEDGMFLITEDYLPTHNSTLAVDFARSAAFLAGKTVLFFSLEMSKEELVQRIIAAEARVELQKIRSGQLSSAEWMEIKAAKEKLQTGTFLIDSSPKVNLSRIRSIAVRQKQKPEGLDMIVIDYLQLMEVSSNRKTDTRQNEVSELSRGLKLLAKELDVPVITLSQLNRNSESRLDRVPQVSDLRESGSLEQDADMVLLIHRPEVGDENNRPGEADLIIGKQRSGPTGRIPLTSMLAFSKFVSGQGMVKREPEMLADDNYSATDDETPW